MATPTREFTVKLAQAKIDSAPVPTTVDIERNAYVISRVKRAGGELRGSSYDRRARTQRLLAEFGDGQTCLCVHCARAGRMTKLDASSLTQDKIFTAVQGGRYRLQNLLPSCLRCNQTRNAATLVALACEIERRYPASRYSRANG